MAEVTKRKGSPKSQKAPKTQGPVEFSDSINTAEIAAILLTKLDKTLAHSSTLAFSYADPEVDINFFKDVLEGNFSNKEISELMQTQFGQGIMMGLIIAVGKLNESLDEQQQEQDEFFD